MKWLIPPVFTLLSLIVMFLLRNYWPLSTVLPEPYHLAGIPLALIGVGFLLAASRQFRRIQTNIHTFRQPNTLVTDGLFAVSRNPMYLGFVLLLMGAGLVMNAVTSLAVAALFFLAAQFWYIPFEEKAAHDAFGDAYLDYKKRVRRWF